MQKNARTLRSFEKNACPTLTKINGHKYMVADKSNAKWDDWLFLIDTLWKCSTAVKNNKPTTVTPLPKQKWQHIAVLQYPTNGSFNFYS